MKRDFSLIIEDDQDLATIFSEALQAAEYETEIIQDGRLALERLADTQPAVVVLDLHLPQISGKKVLDQIRSAKHLAATRVILATADPFMAESLREIADLVLIKPISFGQLRDLAARLRPPDVVGQ
ncbi:MAG TPA: response regulator [Anaerolineae bacterium]|jgi:two-component system response regulator RstA